MWAAFPPSNYYGSSAPITGIGWLRAFPTALQRGGAGGRVPTFTLETLVRLGVPLCPSGFAMVTPQAFAMASPTVDILRKASSPSTFGMQHRNPAHIYQVRASGSLLRGFMTRVPLVHRSVSLAEPAPSGSTGTAPRCQGCLTLLLPYRRSSCPQLLLACCDRPTAVLFHHCTFPRRLVAHDVPAPDLVWPGGSKACRLRYLAAWLHSPSVLLLLMLFQYSIERRLGGQVAPLICQ